jgi:hypothetical protein
MVLLVTSSAQGEETTTTKKVALDSMLDRQVGAQGLDKNGLTS